MLPCGEAVDRPGVFRRAAESRRDCGKWQSVQCLHSVANVIEGCEESQSGRRLLSVVDMWDRDYSLTIIVVYAGSLRTNGARRWVRRSHTACLICQAVLLLPGLYTPEQASKPSTWERKTGRLERSLGHDLISSSIIQ